MTANPFAALLRDVSRYNGHYRATHGEMVRYSDVLAALAAAVPADLAEAGKVQDEANELIDFLSGQANLDGMGFGDPDEKGHRFWWRKYLSRFEEMDDTITAILARIAAQEAQIKGLEHDRDEWRQRAIDRCEASEKWFRKYGAEKARAEAAETALAAERPKVERLLGAWDLARSHSRVKVTLGDGDARKSWGAFLIAMDETRAAITEAGQ